MRFQDFGRWIQPIKRKISLLVSRGILSNITNSKKTQLIQTKELDGGLNSDVERLQQYGLETYPVIDEISETVNLNIAGLKDRAINIIVHNRDLRPTDLTEGQVCLYSKDSSDSNTNRITIKPTNEIEIKTKDGNNILINSSGIVIKDKSENKITMDNLGIKLETSTTDVTLTATSVTVNGILEVLI